MKTRTSRKLANPKEVKAFVEKFDAFLLDCDGVLWSGNKTFENAKETILFLEKCGKKVFFMTNNSTRSREEYQMKFKKKMGLEVDKETIFSSAYLTALYLKNKDFPMDKKVYIVGSTGIKNELDQVNIKNFGVDLHDDEKYDASEFAGKFKIDKDIGAVVCGYLKTLNNFKIAYASACIRYVPGCLFVATNTDQTFPVTASDGTKFVLPGSGSYVASVEVAAQKKPLVIGKPSTFGVDIIIKANKLDKSKICFVGDRLNTDILMANRAKISSLCVLTGITTGYDEIENQKNEEMIPEFYIDKFSSLLPKELSEIIQTTAKPSLFMTEEVKKEYWQFCLDNRSLSGIVTGICTRKDGKKMYKKKRDRIMKGFFDLKMVEKQLGKLKLQQLSFMQVATDRSKLFLEIQKHVKDQKFEYNEKL